MRTTLNYQGSETHPTSFSHHIREYGDIDQSDPTFILPSSQNSHGQSSQVQETEYGAL
jgi:hypothetical protein